MVISVAKEMRDDLMEMLVAANELATEIFNYVVDYFSNQVKIILGLDYKGKHRMSFKNQMKMKLNKLLDDIVEHYIPYKKKH